MELMTFINEKLNTGAGTFDILEYEKDNVLMDTMLYNGHKPSDAYIKWLVDNNKKTRLTDLINQQHIEEDRVTKEIVPLLQFWRLNVYEELAFKIFNIAKEMNIVIGYKDLSEAEMKRVYSEVMKDTDILGVNEDIDTKYIIENYKSIENTTGIIDFTHWTEFDIFEKEPETYEFVLYSMAAAYMETYDAYPFIDLLNRLINKFGLKVIDDMCQAVEKKEIESNKIKVFTSHVAEFFNDAIGYELEDQDQLKTYKFENNTMFEALIKSSSWYYGQLDLEIVVDYMENSTSDNKKEIVKIMLDRFRNYTDKENLRMQELYSTKGWFTAVPRNIKFEHIQKRFENTGLININDFGFLIEVDKDSKKLVDFVIEHVPVEEFKFFAERFNNSANFIGCINNEDDRVKLAKYDLSVLHHWF